MPGNQFNWALQVRSAGPKLHAVYLPAGKADDAGKSRRRPNGGDRSTAGARI